MTITATEENPAASAPANPTLLAAPLSGSYEIETPRLLLRPPTPADEEELFNVVTESFPQFQRWLPWCQHRYTREGCREWIGERIVGWRESQDFVFAIVEKRSGRIVGAVGLNRIDAVGRWANLGYWIDTRFAGQGFSTEAAAAVARFGFGELRLFRIEIVANVENRPSRRVAEKLGATFEGIARNRATVAGVTHDAAVYSLIPGDVANEA